MKENILTKIKFETKPRDEWSPEIIELVKSKLTLQKGDNASNDGANSSMRAVLSYPRAYPNVSLTIVWYRKRAIAAGITFSRSLSNILDNTDIHTYVRLKYRRRGIGKMLFNHMSSLNEDKKKLRVIGWNEGSMQFYTSCIPYLSAPVKERITLADWR